MKICILTTKYPEDSKNKWLTSELAHTLKDANHDITVIALSWLKDDPQSSVRTIDSIKEIRIKLPSVFYRKNKIFTALKLFTFPLLTCLAANRHIKRCDLLIANTPCISIFGVPLFFKCRFKSKLFLVAWDFFPFYLKDLNIVKSLFTFKILTLFENLMFRSFDRIGCMTKKNFTFLSENFTGIDRSKVVKIPLWTTISPPAPPFDQTQRLMLSLPANKLIAVYGGAMSIVQGLDNLLSLAGYTADLPIHFIVVGNGLERTRLKEKLRSLDLKNIDFLEPLNREDYNSLLASCDIGLIFLSEKLTVPSFPSKSLDYFRASLPVLAGIDNFTDFGTILQNEAKAGYFSVANDLEGLRSNIIRLINNRNLRLELGKNGRAYYENTFNVDKVSQKIIESFKNGEKFDV